MTATNLAEDSISRKVVATIRRLVDGNGATADDLKVVSLTRTDQHAVAQASIRLGWDSKRNTLTGSQSPAGSKHCAKFDELEATMRRDGQAAIANTAHLTGLAEQLRTNPLQKFSALQDKFKIADLPNTYHYHESCTTCGGRGTHRCTAGGCVNGQVQCITCSGQGKARCTACNGSGTIGYNESVRDANGMYSSAYRTRSCDRCHGSGYNGVCGPCAGRGRVACQVCGGTDTVQCSPCGATGWFTHCYTMWVNATLKRQWLFLPDAPRNLIRALQGVSIKSFPGQQAPVSNAIVKTEAGQCTLSLDCTVPHVQAQMTCKTVAINVDAVGTNATITHMPAFLDNLLLDLGAAATIIKTAPHTLINKLQDTRVGHSVLNSVGAGRKTFDAKAISEEYQGAVSPTFLEILHTGTDTAYDGLAKETIRRIWLYSLPVLLVVAALSALLDNYLILPRHFFSASSGHVTLRNYGQEAAMGLGLVPFVWLFAIWRSRRAVKRVMGKKAQRFPRQGLLPVAITALLVVVHYGLLLSPYDIRDLPLPLGLDKARSTPVARTQTTADTTWPHGVNLPPLAYRPPPPDTDLPGLPMMWRIRDGLTQLGYYTGPVNGDKITPELRKSLELFLHDIPDYENLYAGLPLDTLVSRVLQDKVHLNSFVADTTLASQMGNIPRSRMSFWEQMHLNDATNNAMRNPNKPQTWADLDNAMGGEVTMLSGNRANQCGIFTLRLVIQGQVAEAGPLKGCHNDINGHWTVIN